MKKIFILLGLLLASQSFGQVLQSLDGTSKNTFQIGKKGAGIKWINDSLLYQIVYRKNGIKDSAQFIYTKNPRGNSNWQDILGRKWFKTTVRFDTLEYMHLNFSQYGATFQLPQVSGDLMNSFWSQNDGRLYLIKTGYQGRKDTVIFDGQVGVDTARKAYNFIGGSANRILYQVAPDSTGFIAAPDTVGQVLTYQGSIPIWRKPASSTVDTSKIATRYWSLLAFRKKGDHDSLSTLDEKNFSSLANKPTSISGYGITDVYTKTELQSSGSSSVHWNNLTNKADAAADGTTKGLASFYSWDFDAVSGIISIDYVHGQQVTGSVNGFVTPTMYNAWNGKQDALVSGTSIKTINSTSLLGSGNITLVATEIDPGVPSWAKQANKPSYTYSEVGAVSSSDSRLTDARPASDVYPWAKASTKPTYTYSEVGAESVGNKVTAFSNPTDTQYPSALLVYYGFGTKQDKLNGGTGFVKSSSGTITYDNNSYSLTTHDHSGTYEPVIGASNSTQYWRGDKTWQTLNASSVGLGNVTNNAQIYSLNGQTNQTQGFSVSASGTVLTWSSSAGTHTLYIPMASINGVTSGLISKTDYDVFNGKQAAITGTGFVKSTSGTISYDNNSYAVASHMQYEEFGGFGMDIRYLSNGLLKKTGTNTYTTISDYLTSNSTLAPDNVSQSSNFRFATDAEKSIWNSKQTGNPNLTAISNLATTTLGFVKMSAVGTFALDEAAYALVGHDHSGVYAPTNQTMYIGTTQVPINRSSGSLSLTGVTVGGYPRYRGQGSTTWKNALTDLQEGDECFDQSLSQFFKYSTYLSSWIAISAY